MLNIQDIRSLPDNQFREELYKILVDLAKENEDLRNTVNAYRRSTLINDLLYLFPATKERKLPEGFKECNGMNKTQQITSLDLQQIIIAQKVG